MSKNEDDWVDKLYKPRFDLDTFLQNALGLDDQRWADKEVQVDLPRPVDNFVHRTCQTDGQLWSEQDVSLLRRAYARKLDDLEQKYSADGSPYDEQMQNLRAEIEEMRENWRDTQQELDACRQELAAEKCESTKLRIAVEGLKRFSAVQLAEADDARWLAQFEQASSQQAFRDHLASLQRQQAANTADRTRQIEAQKRTAVLAPSVCDLASVYMFDEELKTENRRLKSELSNAISALQEYEKAYKMLLKHVNNTNPIS